MGNASHLQWKIFDLEVVVHHALLTLKVTESSENLPATVA